MRVAVAAVATLLWCAFGLAFGSSGLSSERLGWLWMALVYAAGLALEDGGWSASGDNTWKHGIYQATMTQNTSLDEVGLSVSYSGRS
ncbi:hypothetical protein [Nocardioides sp. InS609-2]|uniref:hypothetical protein n=1 Tax=Nocardioides sp. InS609-2 TaxID=2760705 RepID=UPI0020BE0E1C|nr:hypothetical protein [Nocardioides sp. InS609-2]